MELTHDDVRKILQIVDEAGHLDELELVHGDLRIHLRRHAAAAEAPRAGAAPARPAEPARVAAAPAAAAPKPAPAQAAPEGMVAVRAPMLGTFYRAPAPGEKAFVEVEQRVKADDTVCLIEVMKLFNSIKAGVDGKVVQILADNGALVEYNQVLVVIEPGRHG